MIFNTHEKLKGKHSFMSPSNYHWLRYTPEKMLMAYENHKAIERGTELHEFAKKAIELGIKLPTRPATTLNMYVNDAIGYMMTPEQILYYSDYCFGTADAISFRPAPGGKGRLRIHDLKTGQSPTSMDQLDIYAGIFCLEYDVNPDKIQIELRIYQNDQVLVHRPETGEIRAITDRIREMNNLLEDTYGKKRRFEKPLRNE